MATLPDSTTAANISQVVAAILMLLELLLAEMRILKKPRKRRSSRKRASEWTLQDLNKFSRQIGRLRVTRDEFTIIAKKLPPQSRAARAYRGWVAKVDRYLVVFDEMIAQERKKLRATLKASKRD